MSTTARGREGEQLAVDYLQRAGYRIIERNYRWRGGELDVIAEDGDALCFVEVRSREDDARGHPVETVDRAKQRQIIRAAQHYLGARGVAERSVRFDVLGIVYRPELRYTLIRDAFQADGAW